MTSEVSNDEGYDESKFVLVRTVSVRVATVGWLLALADHGRTK